LLLKLAGLEIQLVYMGLDRQGQSFSSIADSVFEQSLVNDSSANTACIYWGSLWGQTCCSVTDGSSSMHLPLRKVT